MLSSRFTSLFNLHIQTKRWLVQLTNLAAIQSGVVAQILTSLSQGIPADKNKAQISTKSLRDFGKQLQACTTKSGDNILDAMLLYCVRKVNNSDWKKPCTFFPGVCSQGPGHTNIEHFLEIRDLVASFGCIPNRATCDEILRSSGSTAKNSDAFNNARQFLKMGRFGDTSTETTSSYSTAKLAKEQHWAVLSSLLMRSKTPLRVEELGHHVCDGMTTYEWCQQHENSTMQAEIKSFLETKLTEALKVGDATQLAAALSSVGKLAFEVNLSQHNANVVQLVMSPDYPFPKMRRVILAAFRNVCPEDFEKLMSFSALEDVTVIADSYLAEAGSFSLVFLQHSLKLKLASCVLCLNVAPDEGDADYQKWQEARERFYPAPKTIESQPPENISGALLHSTRFVSNRVTALEIVPDDSAVPPATPSVMAVPAAQTEPGCFPWAKIIGKPVAMVDEEKKMDTDKGAEILRVLHNCLLDQPDFARKCLLSHPTISQWLRVTWRDKTFRFRFKWNLAVYGAFLFISSILSCLYLISAVKFVRTPPQNYFVFVPVWVLALLVVVRETEQVHEFGLAYLLEQGSYIDVLVCLLVLQLAVGLHNPNVTWMYAQRILLPLVPLLASLAFMKACGAMTNRGGKAAMMFLRTVSRVAGVGLLFLPVLGFCFSMVALFADQTESSHGIQFLPATLLQSVSMLMANFETSTFVNASDPGNPLSLAGPILAICGVLVLNLIVGNLLIGIAISVSRELEDDAEALCNERRLVFMLRLIRSSTRMKQKRLLEKRRGNSGFIRKFHRALAALAKLPFVGRSLSPADVYPNRLLLQVKANDPKFRGNRDEHELPVETIVMDREQFEDLILALESRKSAVSASDDSATELALLHKGLRDLKQLVASLEANSKAQ
ncbi:unnamed protein product [Notodromas monacha]|uniref:Ion transport domain-containing protein n=1 Tax=Notodromas monacha TaxID=399045 RepID=A0A7R9GFR3_9CRUS|nr:unnamed protein product [Notodromas monacha]CAG0919613.1 unnamed protein product [Notodromas monacha]